MNERIRELCNEVGIIWKAHEDIYVTNLTEHQIEKLVELIVKECINQARLEEDRFYSIVEDDLALTMEHFQVVLKQHFGVE